jgi:hypothetical protein
MSIHALAKLCQKGTLFYFDHNLQAHTKSNYEGIVRTWCPALSGQEFQQH